MNIPLGKLSTYSLQKLSWGTSITRIISSALQAVDPATAVRKFLAREGHRLTTGDKVFDLAQYKRVLLVGAGKASVAMASAVYSILGKYLQEGIVVTKRGHLIYTELPPRNITFREAGHPLPDQDGIDGTNMLIDLLKQADEDDLIICVISGGGSALLTSPAPGITLDDLQTLTTLLLSCGASIDEINILRKHLDRVKGGGLASYANKSCWITLVLSDVIGDPLDKIASGPTVPDPSTFNDALRILEKYQLTGKAPSNVLNHIQRGCKGEIPETVKPDDPTFPRVSYVIVGNNNLASTSAMDQAVTEGFTTLVLTNYLQGEAREVGKFLSAITRQIVQYNSPLPRPACLILGGETTVTLHGAGKGGRNQEIALASVEGCAGSLNTVILTLATDGGDGPTDAAGAVVTGETLARAAMVGLDPVDYLQRNDSYNFFNPLGDLIHTGPTLTNVNDLAFIFVK